MTCSGPKNLNDYNRVPSTAGPRTPPPRLGPLINDNDDEKKK